MTIELSDRYQRLIQDRIASGEFASAEAVIGAALEQWLDPLAGIPSDQLNAMLDEGVRDLDEGRKHSAEEVDRLMAEHRAAFLARRAAQ